MKIIEKKITPAAALPRSLLAYLPHVKTAVLDIETTGLSSSHHHITLIGLILIGAQELHVLQFLAGSCTDEKKLLQRFCQYASEVDLFFTYNGDSFDIPFINSRCRALGLKNAVSPGQSIDVYRVLCHTYFKAMLPDLRQKTVEKLFSEDRTDEVSSAECVSLFKRYCEQKDEAAALALLLHNYDDVRLLYETLQVFGRLDVHEIMFRRGFFVCCQSSAALPGGTRDAPNDAPGRQSQSFPTALSGGTRDAPDPAQSFSAAKILVKNIAIQRAALSFDAYSPIFNVYLNEFWDVCHLQAVPEEHRLSIKLTLQSEPAFSYVDLAPFGLAEAFCELPGVFSGFLVSLENGKPNYAALHIFIQDLLCELTAKYGIL